MAGRAAGARAQVPSLRRALRILEYLARHAEGVPLSRVARDLGCPKNSALRLLNTFEAEGYVERDGDGRGYVLSRKFASLHYDSARGRSLLESAIGLMRDLRDETGETVVLSVLDGEGGLTLEQVQGLHPFRFVCDPGNRQPLHASASPKAILAFLPEADRERVLRKMSFRRYNARTIADIDSYRRELERVRSRGYAVDRAEQMEGVHCVAAPVFDRRGVPTAAVTVTGPADRLPASRFARLGPRVRDCALRISRRLGYGLLGGKEDPAPRGGRGVG